RQGRAGGAGGPARARRAPDHALPAHPRRDHARPRARARRRPHRRERRPRSRQAARARGLRVVPRGERGMSAPLDTGAVKKDFPILDRQVHGKRLVYLDSASSAQKPRAVLEVMDHYYETTHANVHRGVYAIAEEATAAFEDARGKVARFIGGKAREVVFTKNGTEGI